MTGWVGAFDQSKGRVPVARMGEAYDAGYRVAGFYCGGGSASKWPSPAEVKAWLSRPGTGVAMLFEIYGTEPIDFPSAGDAHARRARAAARAYGYPDHAAIFVAVDENVTLTQARAALTAYFRNWAAADTCKPVPYVEADAGAILHDEGLTAGTFTPAAYAWNNPPVLYTPANAPDHVLWTQEHNGVARFGGNLDLGHIRDTAPIMWRDGTTHASTGVSMTITDADAKVLWDHPLLNDVTGQNVAASAFPRSINTGVNDLRANLVPALSAKVDALSAKLDTILADEVSEISGEADEAAAISALSTRLDGLPAAIVAALPVVAGGQPGFTDAQLAQIETAAQTALGHLGLTVTA